MKKLYSGICTIIVTAVIGLIVWIHGFFKGMRGALENHDPCKEMIDAADDLKQCLHEAKEDIKGTKKQATEELKGYSTIRSVDDLEDDESDD